MRTNRFKNPSFETGVSGVQFGSQVATVGTTTFAPAVLVGTTACAWTAGAVPTGATVYLGQVIEGAVTPGEWVAARIPVRRSGSTSYLRSRVAFYGSGTLVSTSAFGNMASTASAYAYTVCSAQVPAGADEARVFVYSYSSAAGAAEVAGASLHTDAWLGVVAATEAEALATLVPYFDGSFPRTDDVEYGWEGPPHASASFEREWGPAVLSDGVASIVVPLLTDEHESPSRNRVHALLGDAAPDVTLRPMGARTGTLECYCPTRLDALALLDMHRPGGPFTLTGGGPDMGMRYTLAEGQGPRLRREMPFRRWVVTIPYQEVAT